MTTTTPNWHPHGRTRAEDLAILAAGGETGWWDETGHPAPWPEDFLDPDAGWTSAALHEPGNTKPDNNHYPF